MSQFKTFFTPQMAVWLKPILDQNQVMAVIESRTVEDGLYAATIDGESCLIHENDILCPVDQRITHHFSIEEQCFQAAWDEKPNTWQLVHFDINTGESTIIASKLESLPVAKEEAARHLSR